MFTKEFLYTIPQYIIPQHAITRLAGTIANCSIPWIKNYIIRRFIKKFGVNLAEAELEKIEDYSSFNNFFIRHLKSSARQIAATTMISPVDGVMSALGVISHNQFFQAKGHTYNLETLLASSSAQCHCFNNGLFATFYLSPKDYHRIHMPMAGTVLKMIYVPGSLFSVQPSTARNVKQLFARNERLIIFFNTAIGPVCMVLVGAMIVGAIATQWHGEIQRSNNITIFDYAATNTTIHLNQGDELGYFKLGSTVIILCAHNQALHWNALLQANTSMQFGQTLI